MAITLKPNYQRCADSIENCFMDFKMKKLNRSNLEKKISIYIKEMIDHPDGEVGIDTYVVDRRKGPSFLMAVTPAFSNNGKLFEDYSVSEFMTEWEKINRWVIEIESAILTSDEVSLTPKELTALLLHEIGHIIFSSHTPNALYIALKNRRLNKSLDMVKKEKLTSSIKNAVVGIPINVACAIIPKSIKTAKGIEIQADSLLIKFGDEYAKALKSAIQKIILAFGNSVFITENEGIKMIENEFDWSETKLADLYSRYHAIDKAIIYRATRTDRPSLKERLITAARSLQVKFINKRTGDIEEITVESITTNIDEKGVLKEGIDIYSPVGCAQNGAITIARRITPEIAIEGFFRSKKPESYLPSQYDIDTIAIEADRITNHQDRIYVLDLIYNRLTDLEAFREKMETTPALKKKYESTVNRMTDELNVIRKAVLGKKNLDKKYSVFVKVPTGYEG